MGKGFTAHNNLHPRGSTLPPLSLSIGSCKQTLEAIYSKLPLDGAFKVIMSSFLVTAYKTKKMHSTINKPAAQAGGADPSR